jgi:hypothetical protein
VLPSDFDHAAALIDEGYELARRALDDPGGWTPEALSRLTPHH